MTTRRLAAVLFPILALGVQWALWPWISPYAWVLFFPAVFFSARLCGLPCGLTSTLLCAGLVWYYFLPPRYSWVIDHPSEIISVTTFVVIGYLLSDTHERLRRSQHSTEARFEATFEQAAAGIALVAPDGRWLKVNRRLCEIVGYRREELLARTFQDITHPDDLAADVDYVRRMLEGSIGSYAMEKRYLRKDGSTVRINLTVSLARTEDGRPDYFIAVI